MKPQRGRELETLQVINKQTPPALQPPPLNQEGELLASKKLSPLLRETSYELKKKPIRATLHSIGRKTYEKLYNRTQKRTQCPKTDTAENR